VIELPHRDLEPGGWRLLIERGLRVADDQAHQPVRLGLLDVLDGLPNCETPSGMSSCPTISPLVFDELARPFGRNLAEIVVRTMM